MTIYLGSVLNRVGITCQGAVGLAELSMAKRKQPQSTLRRNGRSSAAALVELPFVSLMAPTPVTALPPPGEEKWNFKDWLLEPKLDGYRGLVLARPGDVRILSRKNNDLTRKYPEIAESASRINATSASIDGEIVALDSEGKVSFQALQHGGEGRFYPFDLLTRDGVDLRSLPIEDRRRQLAEVIEDSGLSMTVELPGPPQDAIAIAQQFGFKEGLVAKRRGSSYRSPSKSTERSPNWLKWKILQRQEFVVGGYRPDGRRVYELIVGYYDAAHHLRFAARVKDGFVQHDRSTLFRDLQSLLVARCPFVDLPSSTRESSQWGGGISAEDMRNMKWVQPLRVVEIGFVEWTDAGKLRHSTYKGTRDDKAAEDIRRE